MHRRHITHGTGALPLPPTRNKQKQKNTRIHIRKKRKIGRRAQGSNAQRHWRCPTKKIATLKQEQERKNGYEQSVQLIHRYKYIVHKGRRERIDRCWTSTKSSPSRTDKKTRVNRAECAPGCTRVRTTGKDGEDVVLIRLTN